MLPAIDTWPWSSIATITNTNAHSPLPVVKASYVMVMHLCSSCKQLFFFHNVSPSNTASYTLIFQRFCHSVSDSNSCGCSCWRPTAVVSKFQLATKQRWGRCCSRHQLVLAWTMHANYHTLRLSASVVRWFQPSAPCKSLCTCSVT